MGAPCPDCVVQDVNLAFESHRIVYEADGKMVPDLTNRNGHRYSPDGTTRWGGCRVKSYTIDNHSWLEPGAQLVLDKRAAFTKSRYLEPN